MDEGFKSEIENVLSFILASNGHHHSARNKKMFDVPLSFFNAAEPFTDRLLENLPEEQKLQLVHASPYDVKPDEEIAKLVPHVERTLDVTWLGMVTEDEEKEYHCSISRARVVAASKLRGVVKGAAPINIELTSAFIRRDLTYQTSRSYLGRAGPGFRLFEYTDARIASLDRDVAQELDRNARMSVGIAITRHYHWGVQIGFRGAPSIHLMTDPTGALEMLKMRDKPPKGRREAILHWVAEHWRHRRRDDADRVRVRAHMRGKTHFEWDGLQCTVVPSPADVASYESGGEHVVAPWERDGKKAERVSRALERTARKEQVDG